MADHIVWAALPVPDFLVGAGSDGTVRRAELVLTEQSGAAALPVPKIGKCIVNWLCASACLDFEFYLFLFFY